MGILINLVLWLVIIGLVWWLVRMLPLPAPIGQLIHILFIIILIFVVLGLFGVVPGWHLPQLNLSR